MHKLALLLLVFANSIVVRSSAADYQQLPGHFGGFDSDGGDIAVADDFQFEQETLLGSINWWGGYFNPPSGPDNFTIRLFSDSGGQPGSLLGQFAIGAADKVATGQFVGLHPEFKYSANLPAPFLAEAGAKYWVSIVNPPRNFWLWEGSATTVNLGVQRSFSGGPWQPYFDNTAFEMVAVPEPKGMILMTAGLAGVFLYFRGRKEKRNGCA
jgi:hypothetical protein